MAKQSGLHQLKGKVDGYSYYRQSGIKAGLMRRINEGLSARVKTSEEFANTRLNNSEFGNAADVAKVLASVITPKFRPMFLNFSQAKLTKSLLALIKQATGDWGQRALAAGDIDAICAAANALAKNDPALLADSITSAAGDSTGKSDFTVDVLPDNVQVLESFGADGIAIKAISFALHAGQYSSAEKRYIKSESKIIASETLYVDAADLPTANVFHLDATSAPISGTTQYVISLAILMPYRTVGEKNYILQEKCTFKMIPAVVA